MQRVVLAEPYRFVPPRHGTLWLALLRPWVPHYLKKAYGIVRVDCRGSELLRASIAAGCGVMLAPNHCRLSDPLVVDYAAREAHSHLYFMASWHVFKETRLQAWLLPRCGVFSVYREGQDREALACAVQTLVAARRPLVVFPEGAISRHNDRLNNLMDGTAFIARRAARLRAASNPPGRVVVHPVVIRYIFDGDLEAAVVPVLERIEHRMAWRPQTGLPLVERVLKVGGAMLALKEIERFGEPQPGTTGERVQRLVDALLAPLEAQWLKGRREPDVIARVKLLRSTILPELVAGKLPAAERERRWRQLEDCYLAQQLSCYPAGYFSPEPTPERVLETVERFEEDVTDVASAHLGLRAVVEVGEALPVSPERVRGAEADPLMEQLRERLQTLLATSLAQARPGALMS